jgi:hypothetical protein
MTTYWCCWCGSTAERGGPDEFVPCRRCENELGGLLGYRPKTLMFPLAPGESPGIPGAARRRFVFKDAATGEVVGATRTADHTPSITGVESMPDTRTYKFKILGTYPRRIDGNDGHVTVNLAIGPAGRETYSGTLTMSEIEWEELVSVLRDGLGPSLEVEAA